MVGFPTDYGAWLWADSGIIALARSGTEVWQ